MTALAALAVVVSVHAAGPAGPVAVMPFKNLSADPGLDWLRAGMAETMVSDLKKLGAVTVVERAQIDHALAEIALQTTQGTEESTAARVGKMTGAKTVVVGSFQQAGQELRLNARFVSVESGEVTGAAKTTGPTGHVFLLQDEIISRLLGAKAPAAPQGRRRKSGEPTLRAYKLYAMALTTASDADKVNYLKEALESDPDFTYAADDLEALRQRLKNLAQRSNQAMLEAQANAEAMLEDTRIPAKERAQAVASEMARLLSTRRYRACKRLSQRVIDLNLPVVETYDPVENAVFFLFLAEVLLHETDRALKTGEEFMKRYPASAYFPAAETHMRELVKRRQEEIDGVAHLEERFAAIEAERQRMEGVLKAEAARKTRQESADWMRCVEAGRAKQYRRAITECQAFVDRWSGESAPSHKTLPLQARRAVMDAHANLGEFEIARALLKQALEDDPVGAEALHIDGIAQSWPND